jgi:hypothetical protein
VGAGFECNTRRSQAIEPGSKRLLRKFDAAFIDDLAVLIQHTELSPSITQVQSNRDVTVRDVPRLSRFQLFSAFADLLFDEIYQAVLIATCSSHLDRSHAVPEYGTAA